MHPLFPLVPGMRGEGCMMHLRACGKRARPLAARRCRAAHTLPRRRRNALRPGRAMHCLAAHSGRGKMQLNTHTDTLGLDSV